MTIILKLKTIKLKNGTYYKINFVLKSWLDMLKHEISHCKWQLVVYLSNFIKTSLKLNLNLQTSKTKMCNIFYLMHLANNLIPYSKYTTIPQFYYK